VPGNKIFDTGLIGGVGQTNLAFTTAVGALTIIMNQSGGNVSGDAWTYTAGGVASNFLYLAFTEDTNLTTTPIKFAPPPFVPTGSSNLYYLPEQDISAINGQSAAGTWQLEIQDDRAGAGLTNTLVSWQLQFTFANTSPSPVIVTPGNEICNPVPANDILWYQVNVPLNAISATNILFSSDQPVNLLFNQNSPSTSGDFTLLSSSVNGTNTLSLGSVPSLVPGSTYYLGVQNPNNVPVEDACIGVDFGLVATAFAFTEPAQLITGTNAQLNGMATPNGYPSIAWFQWGTNTLYGSNTPPVSVSNSFNVVYVTNQISGLVTNVAYHFRLVVSNAVGTIYGFDQILDEAYVVAWGANFAGQKIVPPGLSNVVAIAGAYDHSLALKNNGGVVVWGDNTFNQTNVPAALNSNLVAVAGGESYNIALKNSGTVVAWGANIFPGETNVPAGLSNVVLIASGQYSSLALKNDGTVTGWGANISGLTNVPTALSNAVSIAGGSFHNLGIRNDGTVIAWGDDSAGQTDVPTNLANVVAVSGGSFHSLALKNDGTVVAWGDDSAGQTNVPSGLSNVVAIAAGGFHSLALKNDGTIVAWGDDSAGQTDVPVGLSNVVAIAGGSLHSLALTPLSSFNSNPIVLPAPPGEPQTNTILPGGVVYYQINVPVNADFATNRLLFADAPLNILFTTNTPPTTNGAIVLIASSTNGVSVLGTNSAPAIIPGGIYYLGVQNTNSFAVTYGIEVDFHLILPTLPVISSIVATNIGGTNGFLLSWFAPTGDVFQVQWTPSLAPLDWQSFSNIITYTGPPTPTNGLFTFFDDGSQFPFSPPPSARFYRLILLGSISGLTTNVPQTNFVEPNSIDYYLITVPTNADFATNILDFAGAPVNLLFNQTTPPTGTNPGDFTLLSNSTGGSSVLGTNTVPPLVPGSTYYLGVQNTNGFAVSFGVEVDFHLAVSTSAMVLLGGVGDLDGVGIKYLDDALYICGDDTVAGGLLASYALPLTMASTPVWETNWPSAYPGDYIYGITANSNGVYAAGQNYTLTIDTQGGKEDKGLVVKFPFTGATGGGFGGDIWDIQTPAPPGAFPYGGNEALNALTLAGEGGSNYIYATGNGQSSGANGGRFYLSKLDENSNVLWTVTDIAEEIGNDFSAGSAVTVLNGNIYAAGVVAGQPYLRKYDSSGTLIWTHTNSASGAYHGITSYADFLYAVGATGTTNSDFLIDKWDENGNLLWSVAYDRNATNSQLNGVVNGNGHLFAAGYIYGDTAGGADAVVLEISPATGDLISTNLFGGALDDEANGVDTDNTNLYVIGETKSFGGGTNQLMLLQFPLSLPPMTNAVSFSGATTVTNGIQLQWDAPTNYQFQVQWTTNLTPVIVWNTFTNIVTSTNGVFTFVDDGSQSGGLGGTKFYRLIEYLFP
jgi:hypothetical protein